MNRALRHTALAAVAALYCAGAGAGETPARGADHVVPAWYLGVPVVAFAYEAGPPGGAPDPTAMKIYVTAPIDVAIGVSPERSVPRPEGVRVLPRHQATLTRMPPSDAPRLSGGWFVVPGPRASTETVRAQDDPPQSWPGAPLASAIRLGPAWVALNNHVAIERGVELGLLALRPFSAGAAIWATADWDHYVPERLDPGCEDVAAGRSGE